MADSPIADVIVEAKGPALSGPTKQAPARSGPKWEADARERVRAAIRKYSKPLTSLLEKDANEADTRLLVTDFICD